MMPDLRRPPADNLVMSRQFNHGTHFGQRARIPNCGWEGTADFARLIGKTTMIVLAKFKRFWRGNFCDAGLPWRGTDAIAGALLGLGGSCGCMPRSTQKVALMHLGLA